jgi:hypothetical protein
VEIPAMRCVQCNGIIPDDEETWVQGQAWCPDCWQRSLRRTWGWLWILLGSIVALGLLALLGVFLFFCFFSVFVAGRAGH